MKNTLFKKEKELLKKGVGKTAGLDESGRGPLGGPVVAGAFMVKNYEKARKVKQLNKIKGSKQLTSSQREKFYNLLVGLSFVDWAVAKVFPRVIDRINIKNASELAMARAVGKLSLKPDFLLIDGNHLRNKKLKKFNYELVVRGDQKLFCCAAASIIAKVTRDRTMERYHKKYPKYGFSSHKGYPTKFHKKMIRKYGTCPIHRRSFRLY